MKMSNCPPCEDLKKEFTDECPSSWVKHFVKKYKFEKVKAYALIPELEEENQK